MNRDVYHVSRIGRHPILLARPGSRAGEGRLLESGGQLCRRHRQFARVSYEGEREVASVEESLGLLAHVVFRDCLDPSDGLLGGNGAPEIELTSSLRGGA